MNIKMTVHGNDFLAIADLDKIKLIEEDFKSEYAIKAEVLGPEPALSKLNRSIPCVATSLSTRRTAGTQR